MRAHARRAPVAPRGAPRPRRHPGARRRAGGGRARVRSRDGAPARSRCPRPRAPSGFQGERELARSARRPHGARDTSSRHHRWVTGGLSIPSGHPEDRWCLSTACVARRLSKRTRIVTLAVCAGRCERRPRYRRRRRSSIAAQRSPPPSMPHLAATRCPGRRRARLGIAHAAARPTPRPGRRRRRSARATPRAGGRLGGAATHRGGAIRPAHSTCLRRMCATRAGAARERHPRGAPGSRGASTRSHGGASSPAAAGASAPRARARRARRGSRRRRRARARLGRRAAGARRAAEHTRCHRVPCRRRR